MLAVCATPIGNLEDVTLRVLDPARAEFYRRRGLRTICPTSVAIDVLLDAVRACEIRPAEAPA